LKITHFLQQSLASVHLTTIGQSGTVLDQTKKAMTKEWRGYRRLKTGNVLEVQARWKPRKEEIGAHISKPETV